MDSANTCALDSPVEKRKIICHSVGRARYQNRFRAASQLVTNVSYSDSDKPTRNGMFQRFLSKRTKLISWVVQWFAPGLLCLSTLWGLDLSVVKSWALESQNSFGPGLTCWIYISSHRNSVSFFFFWLWWAKIWGFYFCFSACEYAWRPGWVYIVTSKWCCHVNCHTHKNAWKKISLTSWALSMFSGSFQILQLFSPLLIPQNFHQ